MKILAADISADRAELVLLKISINGQREPLFSKQYEPASFSGPYQLVTQFLSDADAKSALIERFCLSIAAPVESNVSTLSRLDWVFDAKQLGEQFYIQDVSLISDFDSAARGIDAASEKGMVLLNEGANHERGIRVVTGAGHGLGLAWMDHSQNAFNKNNSEGGMVNFAPIDKEQIDLLEYLMKRFNHVSYERILSNEGLQELYRYCQQKVKQGDSTFTGQTEVNPTDWMQSEHFLNACLKKGRMSKIVQQTPIYLVTESDINLQGAIETATHHI